MFYGHKRKTLSYGLMYGMCPSHGRIGSGCGLIGGIVEYPVFSGIAPLHPSFIHLTSFPRSEITKQRNQVLRSMFQLDPHRQNTCTSLRDRSSCDTGSIWIVDHAVILISWSWSCSLGYFFKTGYVYIISKNVFHEELVKKERKSMVKLI